MFAEIFTYWHSVNFRKVFLTLLMQKISDKMLVFYIIITLYINIIVILLTICILNFKKDRVLMIIVISARNEL